MKVAQFNPEQLRSVVRVGVDLAKSVYAVFAVDRHDRIVVKRTLSRSAFEQFLRCLLPSCVVGMEACGGAHAFGRLCTELGLRPVLMAPQAVKPYIGEQKTPSRICKWWCGFGKGGWWPVPPRAINSAACCWSMV